MPRPPPPPPGPCRPDPLDAHPRPRADEEPAHVPRADRDPDDVRRGPRDEPRLPPAADHGQARAGEVQHPVRVREDDDGARREVAVMAVASHPNPAKVAAADLL